jgi:tetratricopeptide (TPR) repeat protein
MPKDQPPPNPIRADSVLAKDPDKPVTPNWEQIVYDKSRIEKWVRGEITLRELNQISGPEMLEMAVIGFNMFEQGRYREARTIFTGLATLDPKEAYYRTALGAVDLAEEDLDSAHYNFTLAIGLNPKEIASFVNRGEVNLRKGKMLEAAYDFKKAVELDPENKDPLSMRARLLAAAALDTIQKAQAAAAQGGKLTAEGGKLTVSPASPSSGGGAKSAAKPGAKKPAARSAGSGKGPGKKK